MFLFLFIFSLFFFYFFMRPTPPPLPYQYFSLFFIKNELLDIIVVKRCDLEMHLHLHLHIFRHNNNLLISSCCIPLIEDISCWFGTPSFPPSFPLMLLDCKHPNWCSVVVGALFDQFVLMASAWALYCICLWHLPL